MSTVTVDRLAAPPDVSRMFTLTLRDFQEARDRIAPHIKRTPLLSSRQLSEATGFDIRLKAELFQRVGSYKIRGPLNKFALMPEEQKRRGVVCSSAGNHAQGVALAAKIHGIRAVVCMASNATPSKVAATKAYGAEVVLHGTIWDEANEKAKELVRTEGLTYVHPFDDEQLIAGQGTLGLEIVQDWTEVDAVVVPIGGGGLISGVSMVVKSYNPKIRVIGVESSDGPAMKNSVEAGKLETIDCRTVIDGLRVRRVGEINFSVVQRFVDDIVALPDRDIFDAMIWVMERCKLVVEGAAAAPVAALLHGLVKLPAGSRVAVVLSGGNVNLQQLRGLTWN
jgi:threonine dehydratase